MDYCPTLQMEQLEIRHVKLFTRKSVVFKMLIQAGSPDISTVLFSWCKATGEAMNWVLIIYIWSSYYSPRHIIGIQYMLFFGWMSWWISHKETFTLREVSHAHLLRRNFPPLEGVGWRGVILAWDGEMFSSLKSSKRRKWISWSSSPLFHGIFISCRVTL